jgi:hypothetical protein
MPLRIAQEEAVVRRIHRQIAGFHGCLDPGPATQHDDGVGPCQLLLVLAEMTLDVELVTGRIHDSRPGRLVAVLLEDAGQFLDLPLAARLALGGALATAHIEQVLVLLEHLGDVFDGLLLGYDHCASSVTLSMMVW